MTFLPLVAMMSEKGEHDLTEIEAHGPTACRQRKIHEEFTYHKPTTEGIERHAALSAGFIALAEEIERLCPRGRERGHARAHLRSAKMWASAAVACNPETV